MEKLIYSNGITSGENNVFHLFCQKTFVLVDKRNFDGNEQDCTTACV